MKIIVWMLDPQFLALCASILSITPLLQFQDPDFFYLLPICGTGNMRVIVFMEA
jgi:hypothetical protein